MVQEKSILEGYVCIYRDTYVPISPCENPVVSRITTNNLIRGMNSYIYPVCEEHKIISMHSNSEYDEDDHFFIFE